MALFKYTWRTFSRELVLLLGAVVFAVPLYLLITLSLKETADVYTAPLALPASPNGSSYSAAWSDGNLSSALYASATITIGTVVCLIAIGSLCAYALARRPGRLSAVLYGLFLLGVILPYQIAVVPMYTVMRDAGLTGSTIAMIPLYTALLMPLTVFLYTGFVRALPREYEEASQVDGAGLFRTFVRVVFPLLRPVTGTVAVLTGIIVWNDFFLQLVFLSGSGEETLPVALYSFVGDYISQWNVIFAAIAISIAPVLLFYLVAQRQLIRGFSGGIRG